MKFKNSTGGKTKKFKLWQNPKTEVVTQLKLWQNSNRGKTQNVKKKSQILKMGQNSKGLSRRISSGSVYLTEFYQN